MELPVNRAYVALQRAIEEPTAEDIRKLDQPKASGTEGPQHKDSTAINALAAHLRVAAEDIHDWLRHPNGIPAEVLRSWIGLWDQSRRQKG